MRKILLPFLNFFALSAQHIYKPYILIHKWWARGFKNIIFIVIFVVVSFLVSHNYNVNLFFVLLKYLLVTKTLKTANEKKWTKLEPFLVARWSIKYCYIYFMKSKCKANDFNDGNMLQYASFCCCWCCFALLSFSVYSKYIFCFGLLLLCSGNN